MKDTNADLDGTKFEEPCQQVRNGTDFRPAAGRNRSGRPREPQSVRSLAADPKLPIALRASKSTLHRWRQHQEARERYLMLATNGWSQRRAIRCATFLDALPASTRDELLSRCVNCTSLIASRLIENAARAWVLQEIECANARGNHD